MPANADKRRKLSNEDKSDIIRLYKQEKQSIREISRQFENKCSRRLIQFIIFPERLKQARSNRDWRKYYTTQTGTEAQRKHRQYKASVLKVKPKNI